MFQNTELLLAQPSCGAVARSPGRHEEALEATTRSDRVRACVSVMQHHCDI